MHKKPILYRNILYLLNNYLEKDRNNSELIPEELSECQIGHVTHSQYTPCSVEYINEAGLEQKDFLFQYVMIDKSKILG